ncbi:MAG: glycosyltransferase family 1 protein [Clostridia bacterium]|nr:glycosyltransferase family 1 protein [Clostridia bacterium]
MSEPIRILNLFTIMNRGGAETMVMNYYRNIDRSRVQFDFLVHRKERGAYDDEIERLGGRIYRMPSIRPGGFKIYQHALKKFFDEHPEYQILHSHMSELGYFAFREAKSRGIKCTICHAHNAPHFKDETVVEKAKDIMRWRFKHKIRPYTDHMFICGMDAGKWLFGRRNRKNFVMMNNAVDAQKYAWNEKRAQMLRREWDLDGGFVICNVGRFNAQKNHTMIIDIFNAVHAQRPDSVLLLVGNGDLEDRIRAKVDDLGLTDSVRFLGVRSDVNDILLASDVFLFPSLYEGLPVTLVEAQSSGIKCVISDAVPEDCLITKNIDVVPLEAGIEKWADAVLEYADGYRRKNTYDKIVKAGFDVKENAKWLEEFYINEYNS